MRRKNPKVRGKIAFSKYFQEFKDGDKVTVIRELSIPANLPGKLQGRTGQIEGKRGRIYIVKIKDQEKEKKFLIEPIHLRKIKVLK